MAINFEDEMHFTRTVQLSKILRNDRHDIPYFLDHQHQITIQAIIINKSATAQAYSHHKSS
jgi:hypothetical protein